MVFCCGQQRDYDEWEALGAEGWDWPNVLEYFRKIEHVPFSSNPLRSSHGPVTVTTTEQAAHRLNRYFLEGCGELGFAMNSDYNADSCEGVRYYQTNINRGIRISSYTAYLDTARKRKNLTILTNAEVLRLTFEDKRCTGVLYLHDGSPAYSRTSRETVLSAGAIGSPRDSSSIRCRPRIISSFPGHSSREEPSSSWPKPEGPSRNQLLLQKQNKDIE